MQKKIVVIIEILFIILAFGYYIVFELIPEYKTKYGSSDKIFNTERYKNMIEFRVDDNVNFALVIDSKEIVYHMMFYDKASVVLYNKNIENNTFDDSIDMVFRILIENNLINNISTIEIVRYENDFYDDFINSFKKVSNKYKLNLSITEKIGTLEDKALDLGITSNNVLMNIDYYSKEVQRKYKDNKDIVGIIKLDNDSSKKLSNNVYVKIEEYILNNNIVNLEKDNTLLNIGAIPADDNLKFYPNRNSWFYVRDGKVYSYIELSQGNTSFGYCYMGSIDSRNEGECVM